MVEAPKYAESGRVLLLSDLLWTLRSIMDLSAYVPSEATPSKLVFQELENSHPELSRNDLIRELNLNKSKAGVLSLEIPKTASYFSIPCHIFLQREKSYCIELLYQEKEDDDCSYSFKVAHRGAVPRSRASKFTLREFAHFSTARKVEYSTNLMGLRSKNFTLYQVKYARRNVTSFSRKRFQTASGETYPFQFFLNERLEFCEEDASLPIPDRWQNLTKV